MQEGSENLSHGYSGLAPRPATARCKGSGSLFARYTVRLCVPDLPFGTVRGTFNPPYGERTANRALKRAPYGMLKTLRMASEKRAGRKPAPSQARINPLKNGAASRPMMALGAALNLFQSPQERGCVQT